MDQFLAMKLKLYIFLFKYKNMEKQINYLFTEFLFKIHCCFYLKIFLLNFC